MTGRMRMWDRIEWGSSWRTVARLELAEAPSMRGYPGEVLPEGELVLALWEGDDGWVRVLGGGRTGWVPMWQFPHLLRRVA